MAGKLTAAQGTGILLVTANVGSLFEDVSLPIDKRCLSVLVLHAGVLTTPPLLLLLWSVSYCHCLRLHVMLISVLAGHDSLRSKSRAVAQKTLNTSTHTQ